MSNSTTPSRGLLKFDGVCNIIAALVCIGLCVLCIIITAAFALASDAADPTQAENAAQELAIQFSASLGAVIYIVFGILAAAIAVFATIWIVGAVASLKGSRANVAEAKMHTTLLYVASVLQILCCIGIAIFAGITANAENAKAAEAAANNTTYEKEMLYVYVCIAVAVVFALSGIIKSIVATQIKKAPLPQTQAFVVR